MIERPSLCEAKSRARERMAERQGVLRHHKPPREVAGRHAFSPASNKKAKNFEAALLRQGVEGSRNFHVSRHLEILCRNRRACAPISAQQRPPRSDLKSGETPHSQLGIGPPSVYESAREKRPGPPAFLLPGSRPGGQKKRISLREDLANLAAPRNLYCLRSAHGFG